MRYEARFVVDTHVHITTLYKRKKDSPNEIRKMIRFLEAFIANSEQMKGQEQVPSGAFNMFDSPLPSEPGDKTDDDSDKLLLEEY